MRQYYMRINYGAREAEDDLVIFYCPEYITRGKFQDTAKLVTNYEVISMMIILNMQLVYAAPLLKS